MDRLSAQPQRKLPLKNASGLTWIDPAHVLSSQIKRARHMGIVTGFQDGSHTRDIYLPKGKNAMAHLSFLSPNHRWVLVAEHDSSGLWLLCRLLPFDGSSRGILVGPVASACTSAAWSPDGLWMFFSADTGQGFHLWRQRFPNHRPEQTTSGTTEEEGVAIAPDGRSLVTSAGLKQSTVWIHDRDGDRQVSSQTKAFLPDADGAHVTHSVFSPDKRKLFYLVRHQYRPRMSISGELWSASLDGGSAEPIFTQFGIEAYDLSQDGKRVVFAARDTTRAYSPTLFATSLGY